MILFSYTYFENTQWMANIKDFLIYYLVQRSILVFKSGIFSFHINQNSSHTSKKKVWDQLMPIKFKYQSGRYQIVFSEKEHKCPASCCS